MSHLSVLSVKSRFHLQKKRAEITVRTVLRRSMWMATCLVTGSESPRAGEQCIQERMRSEMASPRYYFSVRSVEKNIGIKYRQMIIS